MLRKRESLADLVHRYRGVLVVLAIPVALVLLIVTFMPRSPGSVGSNTDVLPGPHVYSIVFDAGSTGSRVHIFKFAKSAASLDLDSDTFEQLKPGLGDAGWAADPARAAASLKPLLAKAVETVPPESHATTPVELRATAGLRLLPGSQAQDILDAVKELLRASPFRFSDDAVSILDGVDEGAYSWMTLNYLLGLIGRPFSELVGVIDLGGGSVQQAFALSDVTAATAPRADYIKRMAGGGQKYNVYVYSYLGYGLMQGRGVVLSDPNGSGCVSKGTTGVYKSPYGGKEFKLIAGPAGSDFESCSAAVLTALKVTSECGGVQIECSFNGAWGGARDHNGRTFYAMSYFFDRAVDAGIIKDKDAISQNSTPSEIAAVAKQACKLALQDIPTSFAAVPAEAAQYLCLDLVFAHSLLTKGMKLDDDAKITVAKKIEYKGKEFEAAWPLGAAINTLSS